MPADSMRKYPGYIPSKNPLAMTSTRRSSCRLIPWRHVKIRARRTPTPECRVIFLRNGPLCTHPLESVVATGRPWSRLRAAAEARYQLRSDRPSPAQSRAGKSWTATEGAPRQRTLHCALGARGRLGGGRGRGRSAARQHSSGPLFRYQIPPASAGRPARARGRCCAGDTAARKAAPSASAVRGYG